MTDSRVEQAARNNAKWCDDVCRAHGTSGEFHDALWFNRHAVPRFYPNVVTLTQGGTAAQLETIQALTATGLPGNWGVKDSFNTLDLTALGFQPAFEATWLWRETSIPISKPATSGLRWTYIQTELELAKWEAAWTGDLANYSSTPPPRLFPSALLANPEIIYSEGEQREEEGCLSLPGFRGSVIRPLYVTMRAQDVTGKSYEMRGEGLLARAFCHEIDHLDGVLFLQHLSMLKRDLIKRKIRKLRKSGDW